MCVFPLRSKLRSRYPFWRHDWASGLARRNGNGMSDARGKIMLESCGPSELEYRREELAPRYDPIGCDFNLPLKGVFHPLGFTVEIATNSDPVLEAAEEGWK